MLNYIQKDGKMENINIREMDGTRFYAETYYSKQNQKDIKV